MNLNNAFINGFIKASANPIKSFEELANVLKPEVTGATEATSASIPEAAVSNLAIPKAPSSSDFPSSKLNLGSISNKIKLDGFGGNQLKLNSKPEPANIDAKSVLSKLFKSKSVGDMGLGTAAGLGVGGGIGAHYAGQGLGNVFNNVNANTTIKPSIHGAITGAEQALHKNDISPQSLFEVLSNHISNNKVPYELGLGAAGLGGLGAYLYSKHRKSEDSEYDNGEDEPGGNPEI